MKKREHKILDHTIISYFLLVIFVQLIDEGLGIRIDRLIGNYIPGYTFETMGVGIGDWITIVAGAFGAFWGLRLINAKYYDEIMDVWNRKWNKEPDTETVSAEA